MKKSVSIVIILVLFSILLTFPASADELSRPTVFIESYTIDGTLSKGEDIIIYFTLRNASLQSSVNNILMNVQSDSGAFFPSPEASNQYFVSSIPPGEMKEVAVYMTVSHSIPDNTYDVNYTMSYQGTQSDALFTSSGKISIAVKSGSFEIVEVKIPEENVKGRLAYVSVRYTNMSEYALNSARIRIEGNIAENQKVIDIGTVRAAASGIAEKNITFTETGIQQLSFDLIYEDEGGNIVISDSFTTLTVVTDGIGLYPQETAPPAQGGQLGRIDSIIKLIQDNAVLIICIAAVICIGAIVTAVVLRKRRR